MFWKYLLEKIEAFPKRRTEIGHIAALRGTPPHVMVSGPGNQHPYRHTRAFRLMLDLDDNPQNEEGFNWQGDKKGCWAPTGMTKVIGRRGTWADLW